MRIRTFVAAAGLLAACANDNSTPGLKADVQYSYTPCITGCGLATNALAAGGAVSSINAVFGRNVPMPVKVTSSDATIANFAWVSPTEYKVTAGAPGSAFLILIDSTGGEIDRVAVTVKATTTLAADNGWNPAPGPTLLAGANALLHLTTKNGNQVLVGTGAVKFTLSGTLASAAGLQLGDSLAFTGAAGAGTVTADCISAHLALPVTVVALKDVTTVQVDPPKLAFGAAARATAKVTALAGATPVFGAECTWTVMPGLDMPRLTSGGQLAFGAVETWEWSGKAGSYSATCTIGGTLTATLPITIN